jgi:ankyrin repeat protein
MFERWPAHSGWAAEKALLIPAEAVAKLHHALTSDRAATFAAVAVELVPLLDLESNSGHGQTSEVQQQQHASARMHPQSQPGQERVAAVSQAPPHRDMTGRSLFDVLRHVRNQDVAHPLHAAAKHGSVKLINEVVRLGCTVNDARGVDGTTALAVAAKRGSAPACKALLDAGASVDIHDSAVVFPVHEAASSGSIDVLELLASAGASINTLATRDDRTPLHCAAEAGHVEAVRWLLDQGADINAVTQRGFSSLHCAVEGAQPDVVDVLLERGCKVRVSSSSNNIIALACAAYAKVPHLRLKPGSPGKTAAVDGRE